VQAQKQNPSENNRQKKLGRNRESPQAQKAEIPSTGQKQSEPALRGQEKKDPEKFLHLAVGPDAETIDQENKNLELKKKKEPKERVEKNRGFQGRRSEERRV